MNNIFKLRAENPYNLKNVSEFSRPMVEGLYHGTEKNLKNKCHKQSFIRVQKQNIIHDDEFLSQIYGKNVYSNNKLIFLEKRRRMMKLITNKWYMTET